MKKGVCVASKVQGGITLAQVHIGLREPMAATCHKLSCHRSRLEQHTSVQPAEKVKYHIVQVTPRIHACPCPDDRLAERSRRYQAALHPPIDRHPSMMMMMMIYTFHVSSISFPLPSLPQHHLYPSHSLTRPNRRIYYTQ